MNQESLTAFWRDQLALAHRRHNHMDGVRLSMLKIILAIHAGLLLGVVLRDTPLSGRLALIVQIGVAMVTLALYTVQIKRSVYTHNCKAWIKSLEQQVLRQASGVPAINGKYGTYYWDENPENPKMWQFSVAFIMPFINALVPLLACVGLGAPLRPAALVALIVLAGQLGVEALIYGMSGSSPYRRTHDPLAGPAPRADEPGGGPSAG